MNSLTVNPDAIHAKFAADCKKVNEAAKAAGASLLSEAQTRLSEFTDTPLADAETIVLRAIRSKAGNAKDVEKFVTSCLAALESDACLETEEWRSEFGFHNIKKGFSIRILAKRAICAPLELLIRECDGEIVHEAPTANPENFRIGVSFYSYSHLADFVGFSVNPHLVALRLWLDIVVGYYAAIVSDATLTEQDSYCDDAKSGETVDYIIGEITAERACQSSALCF